MKTKAKKADEPQDEGYGRALLDVAEVIWESGAGSAWYEDPPIDEALFQLLEYQHRKVDVPLDKKIERQAEIVAVARDFLMQELHSISILAYAALIEMALEVAPQRALKRAGKPYKNFVPVKQDLRKRAEIFLNKWWSYMEEKTEAETRDVRGGARRKPRQKVSAKNKRDFAARVDALRPVWRFIITDFFEVNDYESWCESALPRDGRFKRLTEQTGRPPASLIRKVFQRKRYFEDEEEMPRDLQPQAFAMEQAAGEMGLAEYNYATLKTFYDAGRKS